MEIKDYLTEPELLAALAEEASELAQAALKLRRVLDGSNPTPVTEEEARAHLLEEYADVKNCMEALQLKWPDWDCVATFQREKLKRWKKRLEEKQHG